MLCFWWNGVIVTDEYKRPRLRVNLGREGLGTGEAKLAVLHR